MNSTLSSTKGNVGGLILASASPRRQELLCNVGVDFRVQSADIDESVLTDEEPIAYVARMAKEKALAVLALNPSNTILAADTTVIQGQRIFSKPVDKADAMQVWQQLSNAEHHVMTAVCLCVHDKIYEIVSKTIVEFDSISEAQMQTYWQSGEPQDKAGAYAIQGLASAWVSSISGSYSNVVGLPMKEVNELLRKIGLNWL